MFLKVYHKVCLVLCCFGLCCLVEEFSCAYLGKPAAGRVKPCYPVQLLNGLTKTRSKGRILRFTCLDGYQLYGDKFAMCSRGRWEVEGRFPICVKPSCLTVYPPQNGIQTEMYHGAVLQYDCNSGYRLNGSRTVYCDGIKWNSTVPTCQPSAIAAEASCDFERDDLCGWQQDTTHSFDWQRHTGLTPSGNLSTGPTFDHTLGRGRDGYYMYIESSSPRLEQDAARLVSPVYKPWASRDACFVFWYHLYGHSIGKLSVYVKPEDRDFSRLTPGFSVSGQQGNKWVRTVVTIEQMDRNFQIIIEATRGSGYLGDAAVDDVLLTNGSACQAIVTDPPQVFLPIGDVDKLSGTQSCRQRCSTVAPLSTVQPSRPSDGQLDYPVIVPCNCDARCADNTVDCCQDYADYCVLGKSWQQAHKSPPNSTASWASLPFVAGIAGGVIVLLGLAVTTMAVILRRRRSQLRRGNMADDSDVRFLTADEVLDFNLVRPRGAKDDDYDNALL